MPGDLDWIRHFFYSFGLQDSYFKWFDKLPRNFCLSSFIWSIFNFFVNLPIIVFSFYLSEISFWFLFWSVFDFSFWDFKFCFDSYFGMSSIFLSEISNSVLIPILEWVRLERAISLNLKLEKKLFKLQTDDWAI